MEYPRIIGKVHTQWKTREDAPSQGPEAGELGVVELDPQLAEGLTGLEPGRDLWLICLLDRATEPEMMIHPRGDRSRPLTGLFNTRSPNRPNPLSLTLVRLVSVKGNRLTVKGPDLLDGTPLLDIKPYVAAVDTPRVEEK